MKRRLERAPIGATVAISGVQRDKALTSASTSTFTLTSGKDYRLPCVVHRTKQEPQITDHRSLITGLNLSLLFRHCEGTPTYRDSNSIKILTSVIYLFLTVIFIMPEEQSYLSILRLNVFHIIPKGLNNNNRGCQPTEKINIIKTLKEFNRLKNEGNCYPP